MESELLAYIDQLEKMAAEASHVPFSTKVMVAPSDVCQILDQMRQALPREVVRARHLLQERDRIISEAQTIAEATRAAAQAERESLLSEHSIIAEAMRQAEQLRRETRAACDRMKMESDAYALHSLRDLQIQLARLRADVDTALKTVHGGIDLLEVRTSYTADETYPPIESAVSE